MKVTLLIIRKKVKESKLNRLTYPNGKVYKGEFFDNRPHGKGTITKIDGTVVKGFWERGIIISK